jgi:hypothetical protein
VYLTGRVALEHLTVEELDRVIGVLYEIVERTFQASVRIAYPGAAPRRATPDDGTRAEEDDAPQP